MEAKATIKYNKISPRKLRFLVAAVKRLKPAVALDYLGLSQQRSAKILGKAIKSAVANGAAHNMSPEKMEFKKLAIDEGIVLKRFRAGSKGMGKPYTRRTAHITIVLEEKESKKAKIKAKKQAEIVAKAPAEPVAEKAPKVTNKKTIKK